MTEISVSALILIACGAILFAVAGDTAVAWWETKDCVKGSLKPDKTNAPS